MLPSLENSSHISFRQSRPKVVGTLELYHVSPIPLINVGKYRVFFFNKKGKNRLIINIESGGRGELASCPNFFVWDYSYWCVNPLESILKFCNMLFLLIVGYDADDTEGGRPENAESSSEQGKLQILFTDS